MSETEKLKQIDAYHRERVEKIKRNETPLSFHEGSKILLFLIPHKALEIEPFYDLSGFYDDPNFLKPLKASGQHISYIHEGIVSFTEADNKCISYSLLSGNGIIEAVDGWYFRYAETNERIIPTYSVEDAIKNRTTEYLAMQKRLGGRGEELPVYMFLDILNAKDFIIGVPAGFDPEGFHPHPIYADELNFQRLKIENFKAPAGKFLKAWFDRLWNAGGYPRSAHYDEDGDWINR